MKTKDLIAELQRVDPSGEIECCIENGDIWSINVEPAYYDGRLQVFQFDEERRPISAKRVSKGEKVVLSPIYISRVIGSDYNLHIEYEDEADRIRHEHIDQEHARRDEQTNIDLDRDAFADWVFRKIQTIRKVPMGWVDRIKEKAYGFFDDHKMGPDSPFIEIRMGKSYNDCREEYFEDRFFVDWDNYSRIIINERVIPSGTRHDIKSWSERLVEGGK